METEETKKIELPSLALQIAFITKLRKDVTTNLKGGAVVWRDDERVLAAIEENLIAIRNLNASSHGR